MSKSDGTQTLEREYLRSVGKLLECDAEGAILGCTEIFLLISKDDLQGIPVFDATELHVQAAVEFASILDELPLTAFDIWRSPPQLLPERSL